MTSKKSLLFLYMDCTIPTRTWFGYFIDITTMGAYSNYKQNEFINCRNEKYFEKIKNLSEEVLHRSLRSDQV